MSDIEQGTVYEDVVEGKREERNGVITGRKGDRPTGKEKRIVEGKKEGDMLYCSE